MKFSKLLQQTETELPELSQLFLRYKALKKAIKKITKQQAPSDSALTTEVTEDPPTADGSHDQEVAAAAQGVPEGSTGAVSSSGSCPALSAEEQRFVATLNEDLSRFNQWFMDREEEAVMLLQSLSEELAQAQAQGDEKKLRHLQARIVEVHGSCVLTLHWSSLNFSAMSKILKKHDKRTGFLLRAPYLANVLLQPFNNTSVMSRLVHEAEALLSLAMSPAGSAGQQRAPGPSTGAAAAAAPAAQAHAAANGGAAATAAEAGAAPDSAQVEADAAAAVPAATAAQPATGIAAAGQLGEVKAGEQGSDDDSEGSSDEEAGISGVPSLMALAGVGNKPASWGPELIKELQHRTRLALSTWETLRKTAATPSTVLPAPLPTPCIPSPKRPAEDGVAAEGAKKVRLCAA